MATEYKAPATLHICLSHGWGGLEMYPIRIGQELVQSGSKIYGLCIKGSQVATGMKNAGIETFEVESKSKLLLSGLPKLNKWLTERNVTIVHSHKSGDLVVSSLLNTLSKRRSFFTEHMGVKRSKKDLYHKYVYSHLTHIFSISEETYKRNIKALPVPPHKVTRLWLGTDIPVKPLESEEIISNIRRDLGFKSNDIVIGNVGRLCSGKGQMELLEAFALLEPKFTHLKLLLVGGLDVSHGSDNDFVAKIKDRIAALSLESKVTLAGFRTNTSDMLAAMNIVCLPNHNEAFGLTAIEAMAAQKPIVGANTGALPEILEPVALLCNPQMPDDIANKIEVYLSNPDLQERNSKLAFKRAQAEFSMSSHLAKLLKNYEMESMSNKSLDFSTRIRNKIRIEHNNTAKISNNAKLRDCRISIKGQNNLLVIESGVNIRKTQIEIDGNYCTVHIGKDCVIGHGCYLSSREIKTELTLGANCMLSRNVKVMTSDGHDILKDGKRINPAQSISIGEQVWLADNTTVLKGVKIGDNSIVGINSTLTKSITSGSIAVGNPAKVVQTDISWRSDLTY